MKTIAYLGPENTYTHFASVRAFGKRSRYQHAPTIEDVFHAVEREEADYGVVPVENSLGGAVTHTLDRFIDFKHSPLNIHGQIIHPIRHCLIVYPDTRPEDVRVVFSHPQAFTQCHHWLDKNLPKVIRSETNSTAEAIQYLLREHVGFAAPSIRLQERAAIGMAELARQNKLRAIPIPQERENQTRFLILGLGNPKKGAKNKTSVMFALKDAPGALHDALVPFKQNKINLTKIESRPSKQRAWEYLFFIDCEGHISEPRVQRALKILDKETALVRVLGSYPVKA